MFQCQTLIISPIFSVVLLLATIIIVYTYIIISIYLHVMILIIMHFIQYSEEIRTYSIFSIYR